MKPYPPLGLLYITSHLRDAGFEAEIIDSTFMSQEEHLQQVRATDAPVIGIYVNLMTRANALQLMRAAKNSGATIVLGGPEPVNYVREYLDRGADYIVAGEGEHTLEEPVEAIGVGGCANLVKIERGRSPMFESRLNPINRSCMSVETDSHW